MSERTGDRLSSGVAGATAPSPRISAGPHSALAAADSAGSFGGSPYGEGETDEVPEAAVQASLGCGNPLVVADLREGERVLDLGSGGGIDVLLSGIPIVEHLCGLDQLPPAGFRFHAAPAPVAGIGSFPVRAYAVIADA